MWGWGGGGGGATKQGGGRVSGVLPLQKMGVGVVKVLAMVKMGAHSFEVVLRLEIDVLAILKGGGGGCKKLHPVLRGGGGQKVLDPRLSLFLKPNPLLPVINDRSLSASHKHR